MQEKIEQLRNAILPQFEMVIHRLDERGENSLNYKPYVYEWEKEWKKDIKNHPNYDEVDKELVLEFINHQSFLIINTAKLFELVNRYKVPSPTLPVKISLALGDVERILNGIGYYENELQHRVRQKEHSLALDIQYDLLLIFQESLNILKANCQIHILGSPLAGKFEEARKRLKKAVRKKDIDLQSNLNKEQVVPKNSALKLKRNRDYEQTIWFKVGLKFATGEINKETLKLLETSAPNIAKELNIPEGEKYILATCNGYESGSNKDKNIYASRMKMQLILDYCKENDVEVDSNFIKEMPSE